MPFFNGDAREIVEDAIVDLRSPIDSDFFTMERARVYVYLAVHDYENGTANKTHAGNLQFQIKPTACHAKKAFKSGQLKLAPAFDIKCFSCVRQEDLQHMLKYSSK